MTWTRVQALRRRGLLVPLVALFAAGVTVVAVPETSPLPNVLPAPIVRGSPANVAEGELEMAGPSPLPSARGPAVSQEEAATVGGTWTAIGPQPIGSTNHEVSGRVTALAVDPNSQTTVYLGSIGGGVWKSTNGGTTWTPKTDSEASLSIGALAIDPNNPLVVYAGTGEDNSGSSMYGQGILKSTDGGNTWTLVGQTAFAGRHIGGIAIDRTTTGATQHVFAATDGGLFASTNGGATWSLNASLTSAALPKAGRTASGAVIDVIQDPSTATKFWATISDLCDTEHGNVAVSTDGGTTWANIKSYPADLSRLTLGVGTGGVGYLTSADCSGNLYDVSRTADGGIGFTSLNGSSGLFNYFRGQGYYDTFVGIDPTSNNRILLGGVTLLAGTSSDGGTTFSFSDVAKNGTPDAATYLDFHAVAFTGANTAFVGNDGGVWKTSNLGGAGTTSDWQDLNHTLQITEFFAGTAHTTSHPFGGAQDTGSVGNFAGDPPLPTWLPYLTGDGGFTAVDPNAASSHIAYGESNFFGGLLRLDVAARTLVSATPCPAATCSDRKGFIAPFVMDPSNPQILLAGTYRVYKTTTGGVPAGSAWTAISGDQTLGVYDTLAEIVTGPGATVIFTGSQYGAVWRTVDGGANWTNITGNLPLATGGGLVWPNPFISGIAFNPANPNEVWVTNGGVDHGHVFHTLNSNAASPTWTALDGSGATALPNAPAFSVILEPNDPSVLYVGTYYGVRVCPTCAGATPAPAWNRLGTGLPNTAVPWLSLTDDKQTLVAWTRGRGAWSLGSAATGLTSIAVTPRNPSIGAGLNQPFTATGTYDNGSTSDLSSSVIWASTSPAVATINAGGLARAVSVGTSTITASLAGISDSTLLAVSTGSQSIAFAPLADKNYGGPDFTVSATASSGLAVSFAASGSCTVSVSTVHITGAGSCTVTASQAGNASYNPAPAVSQAFSIAKSSQAITFGALADKTYGDPDFAVSASASSGLTVSFAATRDCAVSGATVHLAGPGSCTVTASQAGTTNYNGASDVSQSFSIAPKALPPKTCRMPKVVGKRLGAARTAIKKRHCRTGKVTYAHSRKKKGLVISQSRRPGKVLRVNTKVNLVISLGRKR